MEDTGGELSSTYAEYFVLTKVQSSIEGRESEAEREKDEEDNQEEEEVERRPQRVQSDGFEVLALPRNVIPK